MVQYSDRSDLMGKGLFEIVILGHHGEEVTGNVTQLLHYVCSEKESTHASSQFSLSPYIASGLPTITVSLQQLLTQTGQSSTCIPSSTSSK